MSRRFAALALLAAVFLAGVAATLGTLRIVESRAEDEPSPVFRPDTPDRRPTRSPDARPQGREDSRRWTEVTRLLVSERLTRAVGLSEEQVEEINQALERHQEASQAVWADLLPVLESQRDSLQAEIGRILTPEQRERFDRIVTSDRDRYQRGRDGRRSRDSGRR